MKINLRVDPERMKEVMTIGDYRGLQEGDTYKALGFIDKFVTDDDGEYLDEEEGRKALDLILYDDVPGIIIEFIDLLKDAASPPPNGRD